VNALPRLPWAVQVNSTRKIAFVHLSSLRNWASESVLSLALIMYISSADVLKCTCHRRADCTFQQHYMAHFYNQPPKSEPSSSPSLPIQHTVISLPVIGPFDNDPHRQKRLAQVGAVCVVPICASWLYQVALRSGGFLAWANQLAVRRLSGKDGVLPGEEVLKGRVACRNWIINPSHDFPYSW
jgi:hypothetical protein